MLKVGLIGLGFMGGTHMDNYLRLEKEGADVRLTAICDIDPAKLEGRAAVGNIDTSSEEAIDFSRFAKYASIAEMLEREELDAVSIALPSYLHKEVTIQCLQAGLHVLCEKPMAMNADDCEAMIAAAEASGKQLMIGQCLRFWPAYVYLKELVEKKTYGEVTSASFFRGGATPTWGPWLLEAEKAGGALLDMHVHDTDAINWLFGLPDAVSCLASNLIPGSGYDVVSANFRYPDGKVVNAQVDWTLQGDFGFEMSYRVNFEQANVLFRGDVKVNPNSGAGFSPELSADQGYYFELKHFVESLLAGQPIAEATPRSTQGTIRISEAEIASAARAGEWVAIG
ncbi:Gfo/Idh/MocA family oxidoreductase [Paenibacillus rhizovicinus]|uniref:Gfo/Idh/MocA family oxidoreductase n=1 Tax=Paenibacillus rhizovicinus TaxID=2704463 RepID=A0A6C0P2S1_9BACL|nr:Gfo/Idh/MocA family oxidoreductase [Paenibacillus rhizovicinus]QHW32777.1 Gfo/Idh/MocA family oxidoreductase [Paenibacillus rhizovicinus]